MSSCFFYSIMSAAPVITSGVATTPSTDSLASQMYSTHLHTKYSDEGRRTRDNTLRTE